MEALALLFGAALLVAGIRAMYLLAKWFGE